MRGKLSGQQTIRNVIQKIEKKWLKYLKEGEDFMELVVDGKIIGYYKFSNGNCLWRSDQNPPGSFSGPTVDRLVDLVNIIVGGLGSDDRGSVPDRCSDICSYKLRSKTVKHNIYYLGC